MSIDARARRLCLATLSALAVCAVAGSSCRPSGSTAANAPAPAAPAVHGLDLDGDRPFGPPWRRLLQIRQRRLAARTEIPADCSTWGPTENMSEVAAERTRALLEAAGTASPAPGTVEQQAADYYASYMDEAAIEAKGLAPLQPSSTHCGDRLAAALSARSAGASRRRRSTEQHRTSRPIVCSASGSRGAGRSHDVPALPAAGRPRHAGPRLLPPRSPRMAGVARSSAAHVAAHCGWPVLPMPRPAAAAIVALETRIARVHATRAESADVHEAEQPGRARSFPARRPASTGTRSSPPRGLYTRAPDHRLAPEGVAGWRRWSERAAGRRGRTG